MKSLQLATLPLAFRIARRELRGGLRGLRVFWLCLTLGVAIVAAVGSLARSIVTGLGSDAQALLGGDIDIEFNHIEASEQYLGYFQDAGDVSAVIETRTVVRVLDNSARRLVELKAVDGAYPLYGELVLDPPMAPAEAFAVGDSGTPGVLLDPTVAEMLGAAVGDRVKIGAAEFDIRALIEREPDRTGRSLLFGATALVGVDAMPATDLIRPGSMIEYHYRIRLPRGSNPELWADDAKEAFPDAAWRLRTSINATPSVERFIQNLSDFLQLVGLTALLVGGVGVSNAVTSYLKEKTRTIATLKCLGAPAILVFQTYLMQTMILAATGVICGVILGAMTPLAAYAVLKDSIPVPIEVRIFWKPLALAAAYGMLTAFVFSLWPLARVRDVPAASIFRSALVHLPYRPPWRFVAATALGVFALMFLAVYTTAEQRQAIGFIGGSIGTLFIFAFVGWLVTRLAKAVGRPRRADLRLALSNLYRPGAPTGNVVLSLGLGLTVLVAIALVEGNMARQVQEALPKEAPNFFFIDIQPEQVEGFEEIVNATAADAAIERVPMLRGRIIEIKDIPVEEAEIGEGSRWAVRGDRQLTWAATPPGDSTVVDGEWWQETYDGPPGISLEADVARDFAVGVGDTLAFNILGRRIVTTILNIREVNWETMGINFAVVFTPGFLDRVPHTHVATVQMDESLDNALERDIVDAFPNISPIRLKDFVGTALEMLQRIGIAVRLVAAVAVLAGALVLCGAVATEHHRRAYDAVVLKVLGATRGDVLRAYCIEYGLLGLTTLGIACAVGSVVSYAVMRWIMETDWVFLPGTLVMTSFSALGLTLLAGVIGTWQALAHPAAKTLRNE